MSNEFIRKLNIKMFDSSYVEIVRRGSRGNLFYWKIIFCDLEFISRREGLKNDALDWVTDLFIYTWSGSFFKTNLDLFGWLVFRDQIPVIKKLLLVGICFV